MEFFFWPLGLPVFVLTRLLQASTECWIPGPYCRIDWTAWAAIGTLLAVLAALWAAHGATREARETRKADERQAERERSYAANHAERQRDLDAAAISLALDHELYLVGALLSGVIKHFEAPGVLEADPFVALQSMSDAIPRNNFQLMSRFADRFVVYGERGAAQLMVALGQYNFIREAPVPAESMRLEDEDYLLDAAASTLATFKNVVSAIHKARLVIKPYVVRFQPEYVDF